MPSELTVEHAMVDGIPGTLSKIVPASLWRAFGASSHVQSQSAMRRRIALCPTIVAAAGAPIAHGFEHDH